MIDGAKRSRYLRRTPPDPFLNPDPAGSPQKLTPGLAEARRAGLELLSERIGIMQALSSPRSFPDQPLTTLPALAGLGFP